MKSAGMLLLVSLNFAQAATIVAVDSKGQVLEKEKIVTASEDNIIVDRNNVRYQFSPHSVFEFQAAGKLRLLRGSVIAESHLEQTLETTSAKIDFVGRVIASYDFKEKSTSA